MQHAFNCGRPTSGSPGGPAETPLIRVRGEKAPLIPHPRKRRQHSENIVTLSEIFLQMSSLYILAVGKVIKYHQIDLGYLIFINFMC